jgi:hypothetical protein
VAAPRLSRERLAMPEAKRLRNCCSVAPIEAAHEYKW